MTKTQTRSDIDAFAAIADHRTGTPGDLAASYLLLGACTAAGVTARLISWPFARRLIQTARVQLADGTRIEGTPMFDSPDTPEGGISGQAGALDAATTLGVARFSSQEGHPLTQALQAAREASVLKGIVAIGAADGIKPGIAVINAERYGNPFGPPVLQVASEHASALESAPTLTLEIISRWRETTACNVDALVQGRQPDLAPVVVMTPKSGWWTCASERGGGIAAWLACLRHLAGSKPLRTVYFTANSGHELGHIGMHHYLKAHRSRIREAALWVHLGANFAARDSQVILQTSSQDLMRAMHDAFGRHGAPYHQSVPVGTRPLGEARDIFDGGGRYISIVASNPWFHHPDDRPSISVDYDRADNTVQAFVELVETAANQPAS
ncbi:MAG: hypothetical protein R3E84_18095 [Pseudomonadales bacterium]